MREHISGVRVNETKPDARIATMMVMANSRKMRPSNPGMKASGMKTAANESVIDKMVKEISPALFIVALMIDSPCSARRTTFSKKTIASSTRKPMARVSAMRSEEHTSELQSPDHLVCRLLLEKKKKKKYHMYK